MATTIEQVLVTTDAVAARLGDANLRLLEVDEDTEAYGRGHIPGSAGVHWKHDLQDPVRREFVGPQAFAELMDRLGIGNDTEIVLYGGNNNWFAAYAYWYFKYYGHQAVKLMDGGGKKWELERRPLTTDQPAVGTITGYQTRGPVREIRALRGLVHDEVLGKPGFGLVDVRSPEEYRGELLAPPHLPQEQAQRPGHIPGARNIPWARRWTRKPGPSFRWYSFAACTRGRASRRTWRWLLTAGSGSAAPTPGSSCTSCWGTRRSATTTAPGPSGAPWWECRSKRTKEP